MRLREDANAEQDLALGGYRDRLAVELAQNAADAAARGGVPRRVSFTRGSCSESSARSGCSTLAPRRPWAACSMPR